MITTSDACLNKPPIKRHTALQTKPSLCHLQLVEDLGISLSRDSALLRHLKEDVAALKTFRPLHPATLQAHNMLQHYLWKEVDPQMKEGFQAALYFFSDPATAMQHVLHCMYTELMVGLLQLCSSFHLCVHEVDNAGNSGFITRKHEVLLQPGMRATPCMIRTQLISTTYSGVFASCCCQQSCGAVMN